MQAEHAQPARALQARAWQAKQDFNRYAALLPEKAVTQQQYDAVKATSENADANLKAALSQLETAKYQLEVSRRQTDAGQSQKVAFQSQATAAGKNVTIARTVARLASGGAARRPDVTM